MTKAPQGSPEWLAQRLGKVTASRVGDVIAINRSGPAASRSDYMTQLLIERLTGAPVESFVNDAMRWGTEKEPQARAVFELITGLEVTECEFVPHPSIPMSGASPDGWVGMRGAMGVDDILEIKCPNSATHWKYFRGGVFPVKYKPQVQWQLACTGAEVCHFVSFDPRFPQELMFFRSIVERDNKYIAMLEEAVVEFLTELGQEEDIAIRIMMEQQNVGKAAATV